jgi:2-polyprenyl-3-methyl-5-hydroxy-6-metoxy-1,4-benzoquinol methylase
MNKTKLEHSSDPVGLDTLDSFRQAKNFNQWMYNTIAPWCKGDILEIGSGIGNISEFFVKNERNIFLSDLRNEYCNLLSKRFSNNKFVIGIEIIDLVDPNFDSKYNYLFNRFDTLFSLNVVEHIEDDILAIHNCKKLLKEDGNLIILVPAYSILYCNYDKELGHYRRYNRLSLKQLFKRNELNIKAQFSFNAFGILGWFILGKIFRRKLLQSSQLNIYNQLVLIIKWLDYLLLNRIGLSQVIIGHK